MNGDRLRDCDHPRDGDHPNNLPYPPGHPVNRTGCPDHLYWLLRKVLITYIRTQKHTHTQIKF